MLAGRAEAQYSAKIDASLRGPVEAFLHEDVGSLSWLKTQTQFPAAQLELGEGPGCGGECSLCGSSRPNRATFHILVKKSSYTKKTKEQQLWTAGSQPENHKCLIK